MATYYVLMLRRGDGEIRCVAGHRQSPSVDPDYWVYHDLDALLREVQGLSCVTPTVDAGPTEKQPFFIVSVEMDT